MKNYLLKLLTFSCIVALSSCDKDAVDVKSDVKGAQNFFTETQEFPVTAFSKATGPVQTNEMATSYLGALKDDTFGTTTTANFITEIVPTSFDPDFGLNPRIKSVKLNIPYFSDLISTDSDGASTYELRSILGDPDATYTLKIFKSDYLLRDLDPSTNFEESQAYYSDFFETNIASQIGGYTQLFEIQDFKPNPDEIVETTTVDMETTTSRFQPGIRIDLLNNSLTDTTASNLAFWNDILGIVENGANPNTQVDRDYLTNPNNFKAFFRGLIFQVEVTTPSNPGSIIAININSTNAGITVDYTNAAEDLATFEEDVRNPSVYRFGFSGIKLNTLENAPMINIPGGNEITGDNQLYLRGFNGAFTVVDLFGTEDLDNNNMPDALEAFKSKKDQWLINEASITFKLDQNEIDGDEPLRVMLYNLNNKQPIVDYNFDLTSNSDPDKSRIYVSEPLVSDSNSSTYKIRVTEYLNNILLRDSTNAKLGLFVSNNVNNLAFTKLKNPISIGSTNNETVIDEIPVTSISSGQGTILNGATNSVLVDDKIKFKVYYTEEN